MFRITPIIKHLIVINIIMYFVPIFLNLDLTNILALHYPLNSFFGFWQYFTHMFMHGNEMHLLSNMFGLWMFGTLVEQYLDREKFLFIYISAGIGAALIYSLVNYLQFNNALEVLLNSGLSRNEIFEVLSPNKTFRNFNLQTVNELFNTPMLGASGALFGILAASAVYFPNQTIVLFPIPIPVPNKILIGSLVISDIILGTFSLPNDNVARFAHVGGAIIGFIIAWYWKKNKQNYV